MADDYLTRWARRVQGQIPTVEPRVLPPFSEGSETLPPVEGWERPEVDVPGLLSLPCFEALRRSTEVVEEGEE